MLWPCAQTFFSQTLPDYTYLSILLQHVKTMYYHLFSIYMQHFLYK
jgi:hypothetical protein